MNTACGEDWTERLFGLHTEPAFNRREPSTKFPQGRLGKSCVGAVHLAESPESDAKDADETGETHRQACVFLRAALSILRRH